MDLDSVSTGAVSGGFLLGSLLLLLIDIVLSRGNSAAIARALHSLPKAKRIQAILIGAFGAVMLRILCAWFAAHLLQTPFLKIAGGMTILWIAVKLLLEDGGGESHGKPPGTWRRAVWTILGADLTLSVDKVLVAAGISGGNVLMLGLSLGLSIPLVIIAGAAMSKILDKHPIILILGAALLGAVGGGMIVTDPGLVSWFRLDSAILRHTAQALCAVGVLALAWRLKRRHGEEEPPAAA
jgi:YjbE family integral membrane protein